MGWESLLLLTISQLIFVEGFSAAWINKQQHANEQRTGVIIYQNKEWGAGRTENSRPAVIPSSVQPPAASSHVRPTNAAQRHAANVRGPRSAVDVVRTVHGP